MRKFLALAVALLLPGLALAQSPHERLLPADSQLFFQWDGLNNHRPAFDKTGTGQMFKGDMGPFLRELGTYIVETARLAAQDKKPELVPYIDDGAKLLVDLYREGMIVSVHVEQANPPKIDAVIVLPKAATETATLFPLVKRALEMHNIPVKDRRIGKRFVYQLPEDERVKVRFGWWAEGEDAVIYIGTNEPAEYARSIDAGTTGIAKNATYRQVRDFKEFETCTRGFVNVAALARVVGDIAPQADQLVDELGLKSLKSITFLTGFDNGVTRGLTEYDIPGPRKGLLSLMSTKKVTLKALPVLPRDATGFGIGTVEMVKGYDGLRQIANGAVDIFAPNDAENIKETIKAFEGVLGINLRDDLFGCFGNVVVTYASPSEGPLNLGQVVAIELKDGKKLATSIEKLVKAVPAFPGIELELKRRQYRSAEIMEIHMKGPTNNQLASFGMYKGWFVYASYPSAIKGFVLRQEGVLPGWKAEPKLAKVLAGLPKEFTALQVSDPRPTVEAILSLTPFALNLSNTFINQALPEARQFDLFLIPNAQDASRHLSPTVSVTIDDGKKVRTETRDSPPSGNGK